MGFSRPDEEFRADHERDHRKHDTLPHRCDVSLAGALEIASLARAPGVNITEAAQLIEAYARTKASEAKLDAVVEVGNRICSSLERSDA